VQVAPERTVFVILSFEGPDVYSQAGGLGVRVKGLSRTLATLGYETYGWGEGVNWGPTDYAIAAIERRLREIRRRHERKVTLIGHSLGGMLARELAKKFAQAHAELTDWIKKNPEEAQRLIKAELLEETRSDMSPQVIAAAWKRIVFTAETPRAAVEKFMQNSVSAGFIKTAPDLSKLFANP